MWIFFSDTDICLRLRNLRHFVYSEFNDDDDELRDISADSFLTAVVL